VKTLCFHGPSFRFATFRKAIADAPDDVRDVTVPACVVAFLHCEAEDAGREAEVVTKLVKHLKWLAGKANTRTVVLHWFSHLSDSIAPIEVAQALVAAARQRLESVGFAVEVTPFGHFCALDLHVAGESHAKVWKAI
jgi:hypothetical protein